MIFWFFFLPHLKVTSFGVLEKMATKFYELVTTLKSSNQMAHSKKN